MHHARLVRDVLCPVRIIIKGLRINDLNDFLKTHAIYHILKLENLIFIKRLHFHFLIVQSFGDQLKLFRSIFFSLFFLLSFRFFVINIELLRSSIYLF